MEMVMAIIWMEISPMHFLTILTNGAIQMEMALATIRMDKAETGSLKNQLNGKILMETDLVMR